MDRKRLREITENLLNQSEQTERMLKLYKTRQVKAERLEEAMSSLRDWQLELNTAVGKLVWGLQTEVREARKSREKDNIKELGYK